MEENVADERDFPEPVQVRKKAFGLAETMIPDMSYRMLQAM
jgi:hypothetical protein